MASWPRGIRPNPSEGFLFCSECLSVLLPKSAEILYSASPDSRNSTGWNAALYFAIKQLKYPSLLRLEPSQTSCDPPKGNSHDSTYSIHILQGTQIRLSSMSAYHKIIKMSNREKLSMHLE